MTGDIRVIEDGADRRIRVAPPTPPWVWILVGLAVGVGFAVVFVTSSSTDPGPEAVVEIDPVTSPDSSVGVGEVVPDFPDALVLVVRTGLQDLEHLLWPKAGDPAEHPLPVAALGESKFDASGTWLAVSSRAQYTGESFLSMGRPRSLRPLAAEVTSFAWHDGKSALLAYTQSTDDGWQLWVSHSALPPKMVAEDSENIGEVAAWGDWGWAIQGESGTITLLNNDGEREATFEGTVLDSRPGGWILMIDEQVKLLSAGGDLLSVGIDLSSVGSGVGGAIAPDGKSVAIVGSSGLNVAAVAGDAPEMGIPLTGSIGKISWSSDSGFVIIPSLRGVMIVDVESGEIYEELKGDTVVEASVIPLRR